MEDARFQSAVARLKNVLKHASDIDGLETILSHRDEVLERFGQVFAAEDIDTLSPDDYREFLQPDSNYHWTQLYRGGNRAADDIQLLRDGLRILLDERRPIADRINVVQVPGLGIAIKSAILMVSYPAKYGVWNAASERALTQMGLFPSAPVKKDKGKTYEKLNELLRGLATAVDVDLWTLDGLLWALDPERSARTAEQMRRIR